MFFTEYFLHAICVRVDKKKKCCDWNKIWLFNTFIKQLPGAIEWNEEDENSRFPAVESYIGLKKIC